MEIDNDTMRVAVVLSFKKKFEELLEKASKTDDMRLAAKLYREAADHIDDVADKLESLEKDK